MMVSMHSNLYAKYRRFSIISSSFLIVSGAILNALVFVDFRYMTWVFETKNQSINAIGWFSILTFSGSLLSLSVNWKERSESYLAASNELSGLLNECREILESESKNQNTDLVDAFNRKYIQLNGMLPKIPEKSFNCLKARHYKKVELSKFIGSNKGKPYWLIRINFFIKSIKND